MSQRARPRLVCGIMATRVPESRETYESLRPLLFSIAYRMVGSVSEAEDIVQEAYLRHHRAVSEGDTEVREPKAWLSAVTTRLAIDHLRSARVRRETYVGPWLPEPLMIDPGPDPSEQAELVGLAVDRVPRGARELSPVERAVYLLREVFGYGYDEVARVVDRTEDNCRQLAARARRHVEAHRPRFAVPRERQEELTERFMQASRRATTTRSSRSSPRTPSPTPTAAARSARRRGRSWGARRWRGSSPSRRAAAPS